jgi:hypothetical protein
VVLILLILVGIRIHTYAWPWLTIWPMQSVRGEENGWHYALALTVRDNLAEIYLPHAQSMLKDELLLGEGNNPQQILKELSVLPGVKAAFLCDLNGGCVQYPDYLRDLGKLHSSLVDNKEDATWYPHNIMRRKVGGLTRFFKIPQDGDSLDIMVRYCEVSGAKDKVLGLVLDTPWLIAKIPSYMDSVAREDETILFCSNTLKDLQEQALGLIYRGDTLWWQGDRSLPMAEVSQVSGVNDDIEIRTRFHWIEGEKRVADHMPGIRRWFASAEILGVVALVLALFAIRPKKKSDSATP